MAEEVPHEVLELYLAIENLLKDDEINAITKSMKRFCQSVEINDKPSNVGLVIQLTKLQFRGSVLVAILKDVFKTAKALKDIETLLDEFEKKAGIHNKSTQLHTAVEEGNVKRVQEIMNVVSQLNQLDGQGRSPLYIAAFKGNEDIVDLLLEYDAKLRGPMELTAMVMCRFAADGCKEGLTPWLKAGANQLAVQDYDGRTPMHVAAQAGKSEVIDLLIAFGMGVNVQDRQQNTPLNDAIRNMHMDVITILKNRGASLAHIDENKLATELCIAASKKNVNILKAWHLAGANLNASDYDDRTALHVAESHAHEEVINFLRNNGARGDVSDAFTNTADSIARDRQH